MNKIKLFLFLLFSIIAPCGYLIIRFNLFQTTTKTKVGFWGVMVVILLITVVSVMIKYYIDGLKTKYSYFKQLLQGFMRVIMPMALILLIIIWLGNNIAIIKEVLYVVIPCEVVAIFINPFPKWCFDNNIEGLTEIVKKIGGKK